MRIVVALSVLGALAMGGCVGGQPVTSKEAPVAPDSYAGMPWDTLGALGYSETHDHRDRSLHHNVTRGLELLNASTLSDDGKSLGEYNEADVLFQRDLVAVAAVTGPGSTMRIAILDAKALPKIQIVSRFDEPSSYGDVKFDQSLPLVYVPYASNKAFSIWDISDLKAPKRVGEAPGPGCHMLHPLAVMGSPYVFCAGLGGSLIYRVESIPGGTRQGVLLNAAMPQSDPEAARYLSYYQSLSPIGPALITTPHDQTAQLDPVTKAPILVTAYELQGIRVFDVSTPAAPREIGHWRGQGMSVPMERVHTVGIALVQGKRLGFAATETFTNVQPSLYIVDFTDYANPTFVSRWSPPGEKGDQGIAFSMHNLQVVGNRLYATNFHGGLWVLDLADPVHPTPIALRVPVRDTEYPRPGDALKIGSFTVYTNMNQFWDVVVVDGYTIATDMSAGIEVLHVDGDPAGDPTYDGFT